MRSGAPAGSALEHAEVIAPDTHPGVPGPPATTSLPVTRSSPPGTSTPLNDTGTMPADDCVLVGTVQLVVPHTPGEMVLDVTLDAADVVATNRDTTTVVR